MKSISCILGSVACFCTAMIGHTIHHSLFWSVVDFFFAPFAWGKWLICHEVTMSIIKQTFAFFFS